MDILPEWLMDRFRVSYAVSHLHGKSAHEASELAGKLFDLCVDQEGWDAKGYPFDPKKIRENYDAGNLDLSDDYRKLLEYAAQRCDSTREAIESIRKQETDWITGDS